MAELSALVHVAAIELTVKDHSAAHAGAYEETDYILVASCSAVLVLAQNTYVYIVADIERNAELLLHGGLDVIVSPGKVGGEQDDTLGLIDDARRARGDRGDLFLADPGSFQHLFHHADDHFLNVVRGVSVLLGLFLDAVNNILVLVKDHAEDLCSTNIETDVILFCHNTPPWKMFLPNMSIIN